MPNENPHRDPLGQPDFSALIPHYERLRSAHMRDLFNIDPNRAQKFSLSLEGLTIDFSKHLIDQAALSALCELARKSSVEQKRDALFKGSAVNKTEDRAALHTALRDPSGTGVSIGGQPIAPFVRETNDQMRRISEDFRSNPDVSDIVHIGIGGSDLGPRMICRALAHLANGPNIHFAANIDPADLVQTLRKLNPRSTRFIIASKTFTTLETVENARLAMDWLEQSLSRKAAATHMTAITMNIAGARDFGIAPENILPLQDWIGGRFSLWSAIGLPISAAFGHAVFESLLAGAHAMDVHFKNAPLQENMPVLIALLGIWYRNIWDFRAHAVLPYAENLNLFPAYIQQLEMESNGKSAAHQTSPVVFGASGTNAQHAFYQMLHQGSDIIPCDFIIHTAAHFGHERNHKTLIANALAQAQALMEGSDNMAQPHRHFPGNRPSTMIGLESLDPYHLGMLVALYEHKVFVQGAIWNINSFDQWGVELGKKLALPIQNTLETGRDMPENLDSSTKMWLEALLAKTFKKNS